ncbi:MAG: LCP family protein [bacterium]|nr:LCP family protein [bacterium]
MSQDIDLLHIEQKNLPGQSYQQKPRQPRRRRSLFRRVLKLFTYVSAVAFIIIFIFTSRMIMSGDNTILETLSLIGQLTHLAETSESMLKGEEDNRINILMLGMGGYNHEGGLLTDTIMLASIVPSTHDISLLSIPRDLIVPTEKYGWIKINHVNAYAENEETESGGIAISQALARVLDLPIDYYIRVDFAAFEQIVDDLGGIEVEVENLVDDYRYPVMGEEDNENYDNRYEHLRVEPGLQKMDGALALKFARSRHSAGVEGSDFARSRRQQKILQAVKEKVNAKNLLFKPRTITNILNALKNNIKTNLKTWEMAKLWSIVKEANSEQITTNVLDNSAGGFLMENITEQGAYVLEPKSGDFNEIQYFAKNILASVPPQERSEVVAELPKIEIQNGTWVNGLAQQKAADLSQLGFEIVRSTNATQQNYEKSIIFDLTYGEKMKSLEILKNYTNAKVNYGLPDWMLTELEAINENDDEALTQPDFILILGRPADITKSGLDNEEEN